MTPDRFAFVAAQVKARAGIVLAPDQAYMLETRLAPVLRRDGLASLDALADRLREPFTEPLLAETVERLTTNESSFFRDGRPFDHLRRLLPRLLATRPPGTPLRLWSAACSTGQEAYSAAIVLAEAGLLAGRGPQIVGTDLSRTVVARAAEGIYTQFEVQRGLSPALLARHFRADGARWQAAPELRAAARFSVGNLLAEPLPAGRFDAIFCRNVLIYFDPPTKARVLAALAARLAADGVLYLGAAETVLGLTDRLVPVPGERGVYEIATA